MKLMRALAAAVPKACAAVLIFAIRLYQMFLSPLLPNSCRFYPSCSSYAMNAIAKFGPLKGSLLAGWRLLRCHPLNDGGFDPVPDTFRFSR